MLLSTPTNGVSSELWSEDDDDVMEDWKGLRAPNDDDDGGALSARQEVPRDPVPHALNMSRPSIAILMLFWFVKYHEARCRTALNVSRPSIAILMLFWFVKYHEARCRIGVGFTLFAT